MIYTKGNQKKEIESDSCGLLTEYLNSPESPISITLVKDIKPTKAHFHKVATEIYWVREGSISILLNDEQIELAEGDSLVIQPGEVHTVIKASEKNEVIVLCNPPWDIYDKIQVAK